MNIQSRSESYAAAGVDITAGYKAVELMKSHIARTMTSGVCSDVGGFGGLFELDTTGIEKPVLVSGTDGVGTKLKLAFLMDKHDTVGIDCVAMCVNDIICCGAKPQFFLDYIACGKNIPEKIAFFEEQPEYDKELFVNKKSKTNLENSPVILKAAIGELEALSEWNFDSIHDCLIAFAEKQGIKNGTAMWPVRIAASGMTVTPGGAVEILDILGREESLKRLNAGLAKL